VLFKSFQNKNPIAKFGTEGSTLKRHRSSGHYDVCIPIENFNRIPHSQNELQEPSIKNKSIQKRVQYSDFSRKERDSKSGLS